MGSVPRRSIVHPAGAGAERNGGIPGEDDSRDLPEANASQWEKRIVGMIRASQRGWCQA